MKISIADIIIRPLSDYDSLVELTDLLHLAYKKQADKGFVFLASHQDVEMTKYRLEEGECYVGVYKGKFIATCTYYRHNDPSDSEWYNRNDVATYGQFGVAPEFQNCGLGTKLMDIMEDLARRDKVSEITIDTAEGASDLISFYKEHGYREVGYVQWTLVNYRSLVLSKKL